MNPTLPSAYWAILNLPEVVGVDNAWHEEPIIWFGIKVVSYIHIYDLKKIWD